MTKRDPLEYTKIDLSLAGSSMGTPKPVPESACPGGKRFVKGFRRKDGTMSGAFCASKSRGPRKRREDENELAGWRQDRSTRSRHRALNKAVEKRGCESVVKDLATLGSSKDPMAQKAAAEDADWVRRQKSCRLVRKKGDE